MFSTNIMESINSYGNNTRRREVRNIYRLQQEDIRLPRPVAFISESEKNAYRKNRVEESQLQMHIRILHQERLLADKSIRCQAAKFKIDKASFIRAYLSYKNRLAVETLNSRYRQEEQKSTRQRKQSMFFHSANGTEHPLSRVSTPGNGSIISIPVVAKIHYPPAPLRPHTANQKPPIVAQRRSKSADPRLFREEILNGGCSPVGPRYGRPTQQPTEMGNFMKCSVFKDGGNDVFRMFNVSELKQSAWSNTGHLTN